MGRQQYVLEYGVRGGACVDNLIIVTAKQAAREANLLTHVLSNGEHSTEPWQWFLGHHDVRRAWVTPTHYVAVSRLPGAQEGSASSKLWHLSYVPEKYGEVFIP